MFRTMLVEDNSSFRQVVKNNLKDQFPSIEIIEAADGVEALKEVESCPPHLILMDVGLPGMSGLELTRKIKASYPNVIVIILTGYDLRQIQEAATQCKADYFFSKGGIATGEITALVKSILLEKGFRVDGSPDTFPPREKTEITPRILKRRIWWEPVSGASGYVVYAGKSRGIFEPDHFAWETTPGIVSKLVTGKTEVIIPDEWPQFPTEPGIYYIGITSKDDLGNQSDPFLLSGQFKFTAPPAPSKGGIEYLSLQGIY